MVERVGPMNAMRFLTAFCAVTVFTLPFALGAESEDDCKYYVKKMMATKMKCYLIMGNSDPVCEAGVSSSEHCRIEVRGQEMYIKWPKSLDIYCQNETYSEDMEGTSQDCAADQASLDCAKEFSIGLDNGAAIAAVPGHRNSAPTINADLMVVVLSLVICIWFAAP
ncbi:hypothetical protein GJAV_G00150860 [Gymnothorax javanicus]|nr:hypothetical protein GJAV_G00150860 [Gymnothorax javanicus]